ncbi:MAG TPA: DUF2752 domain-containing protein [Acidimicrobiia bacterium]|nr:DUF2752 domain-containing protein [Acidimicrobiia bacterium]
MSTTWRHRLFLVGPATLVGALAVIGPIDEGPTLCPFALCTGMACPGCGMTRAASHLIRGDVGTALGYHPLILPFAALSLLGTVWYLLRRWGRVPPLSTTRVNTILVGVGVMLVGVWVARALSGTLPPV